MTQLVFIDEISFDLSPKVRVSINDDVVSEYAERYSLKEKLPPIHVFKDTNSKTMLLADGAHRCYAKAQLGIKGIEAEMHEGGFEEALTFALTANSKHGLPRTNADKRTCVKLALKQWPDLSNSSISRMCDVNDHTVSDVRKDLESANVIPPAVTRKSSDGRDIPAKNAPRATRISESLPPKDPPIEEKKKVIDAVGTEVPISVIKYWSRASEVSELMSSLSSITSHIKKVQKEEDLMYAEVNMSALVGDLEKSWTAIQCAIPYAVCTQCQGHPEVQPKGHCRLCFGKGLISKFRYERLVPEEIRKMKVKK